MQIFVTGATGYIGGAVAVRLRREGHRVTGLARTRAKAEALEAQGIEPVEGTLFDPDVLADAARAADAVVNAASADNAVAAEVLADALAGSGKALLHTSGTSVVADRALGEPGGVVHSEDMPLDTLPDRLLRVAVERIVLRAAERRVRAVVLRPSLIYGRGPGLNPHSHQLPTLARIALARGRAAHVGRGLNVWSNVHIDDVADLYVRALNDAPAGSLFFAENGEASWRDMAAALGRNLGLGETPEALSLTDSLHLLGVSAVTSFGSNSRVDAAKARGMLGWKPTAPSIREDLESGDYRTAAG